MNEPPLDGVRVLDLSRVLAGPYCTMMLAELGARVIKVENPAGGDDSRHFEPFVGGQSGYFQSLNRDKESIALLSNTASYYNLDAARRAPSLAFQDASET